MGGVLQLDDALITGFPRMVEGLMDIHVHGFGVVSIVLVRVLDDAGRTEGH